MGTDRTEGDIHAHHSTCTGERTGSVLDESGFSRDQARGRSVKPGSIGLSKFPRLYRVLLPQRQAENSEAQA
jgi:hypothetical protein